MGLPLIVAWSCSDPATPTASRIEREGLRYVTELTIAGPDLLAGVTTVANTGRVARTIRFPDRCVALFRLYFPDGRLAWDQFDGEKRCQEPAVEIALAPGAAHVVEPAANASMALFGNGLPSGSYRVAVYLRPEGEPLVEIPLGTFELRRAVVRS